MQLQSDLPRIATKQTLKELELALIHLKEGASDEKRSGITFLELFKEGLEDGQYVIVQMKKKWYDMEFRE